MSGYAAKGEIHEAFRFPGQADLQSAEAPHTQTVRKVDHAPL